MKRKITTALMTLGFLATIVMFSACGGGGGGDEPTPPPPPDSDLWQGVWTLNTQETDWGEEFNNELPHYVGSYFEIDGNSLRVVFVRDGLVEMDATGTFFVEGSTFTSNIEGESLVGTYDLQNDDTKAVIYWSEASGGDTEVYDKAPPVPVYAFGQFFLQYRVYESAIPGYTAWLPMTKNGIPVQETDIDSVNVFNSSDNAVTPTNEGFYSEVTMFLNCLVSPCVESGPLVEHAWLGNFPTAPELLTDMYNFEVDTYDGQALDLFIPYLGQLELPIINVGVMNSTWSGSDLVLSWTNPVGAASWSEVDQLRIRLFDGSGVVVLAAQLNFTAETVTIPGSLLEQASVLGDGLLESWEIQTRALDANKMNFARGYSSRLGISAP